MKFQKATIEIIDISVKDVCTTSPIICQPVTMCEDEF